MEIAARCGKAHISKFDQLGLVVNHEIAVGELGEGDLKRGHILKDVNRLAASGRGLEFQEAEVIGKGTIEIGNLVAHIVGAQSAVRVINKNGAGGVLDHLLVVVGGGGNHDDLAFELVLRVVVDSSTVVGVGQLAAQLGDVGTDKLAGDAVSERDGVGSHHVAGHISHIVDNQGVGRTFGQGGGGQGDDIGVEGGGRDRHIVVQHIVGGRLGGSGVQRLVEGHRQGGGIVGNHRGDGRGPHVRTGGIGGNQHIVDAEGGTGRLGTVVGAAQIDVGLVIDGGDAVEVERLQLIVGSSAGNGGESGRQRREVGAVGAVGPFSAVEALAGAAGSHRKHHILESCGREVEDDALAVGAVVDGGQILVGSLAVLKVQSRAAVGGELGSRQPGGGAVGAVEIEAGAARLVTVSGHIRGRSVRGGSVAREREIGQIGHGLRGKAQSGKQDQT